jgi:hypothetical protein
MTDTVDTQATPVDPLLSKEVTLTFTVGDINAILQLLSSLPYIQSVGLIQAIQTQVGPQVAALNAQLADAAAPASTTCAPTAS